MLAADDVRREASPGSRRTTLFGSVHGGQAVVSHCRTGRLTLISIGVTVFCDPDVAVNAHEKVAGLSLLVYFARSSNDRASEPHTGMLVFSFCGFGDSSNSLCLAGSTQPGAPHGAHCRRCTICHVSLMGGVAPTLQLQDGAESCTSDTDGQRIARSLHTMKNHSFFKINDLYMHIYKDRIKDMHRYRYKNILMFISYIKTNSFSFFKFRFSLVLALTAF